MAFTLYLVRHSKAHSLHPEGDRWRELSPEGFRRIEELLPRLDSRGFAPELYLSSPYVRARQTCETFQKHLDPEGRRRFALSEALIPDGDVEDLLIELKAWAAEGLTSCAVFTHNPFVTILAENLAYRSPGDGFHFHTPTVTAFSFLRLPERHRGEVLWTEHRES